jgi:hypothetical protein
MTQIVKHSKSRLFVGVALKCVDGHWNDADGLIPPDQLLVIGTTKALQCWQEQKPIHTIVETPGEPLPDIDTLNEKIPREEWEEDLNGNPRPPWQLNYVVYLLDPDTADTFTWANSTTGARIAFERLTDKFTWMRAMRGANVLPLVKLDSRPMTTKFGVKQRPEFTILEWRDLGVPAPAIAAPQTPLIEQQKTVTPAEESAQAETAEPAPAPKRTAKPTSTKKVGKPVKPVSLREELNDQVKY